MAKGLVILDKERCKGCSLCVAVCPQGILKMSSRRNSSGYAVVAVHSASECITCGQCVMICPDIVFTIERREPHGQNADER